MQPNAEAVKMATEASDATMDAPAEVGVGNI